MRFTTLSLCGLASTLACGLAVLGCTSAPMATSVLGERDLHKLGDTYSFTIGGNNRDQRVGDAFTASNALPNVTLSRIKAIANTDLGTSANTFSYARDINNNLWWAAPDEAAVGVIRSI